MLALFKINDPYRLIIVLLFLILAQLPFYLSDPILTLPEIEWQTLGQKLGNEATLYVDVYHPTGMLSSMVYWILAEVFPDNYFIYRLLALILIFLQAVMFNVYLIRHKAYNQNSYVPAILYAVLMMSIPDFAVLTPQLMSLIFVLLAFDLTFRHIEGRRKRDWIILRLGFYLGISSLFYSLNYLLLISTVFAFLFYTNTMLRRYILLFAGFLLPYLLIWLKYFWFDQLNDFYLVLPHLFIPGNDHYLLPWQTLVSLMIISGLFLLISFFKIIRTRAFINYQVRLQNFMFFQLVIVIVIVILDYYKASHALVLFVPALSFFLTHYFTLLRKRWLAEGAFLLFVSLLLFQNYSISFGKLPVAAAVDLHPQVFAEEDLSFEIRDEKILVIGPHTGEYYQNTLGSPYFSWSISKEHFNRLDEFKIITKVYTNINNDLPGIIIDKEERIPELFEKIPILKNKYEKTGENIYSLIPANPG